MPWARLPPDRLIHLPLFNINFLKEDGDILWYEGPDGRKMAVDKRAPRIWFETIEDAHQAGAVGIMLSPEEAAAYRGLKPIEDNAASAN